MAYKLLDTAQARWRAVNAPHLVAAVRDGVTFTGGALDTGQTRADTDSEDAARRPTAGADGVADPIPA